VCKNHKNYARGLIANEINKLASAKFRCKSTRYGCLWRYSTDAAPQHPVGS
jgi:hypothetical protein